MKQGSQEQVALLLGRVSSAQLSVLFAETLILARTIGHAALEKWVRQELHGYQVSNEAAGAGDTVPGYRAIAVQRENFAGRRLAIDDPRLGYIHMYTLRDSISEVEQYAAAQKPLVIKDLVGARLLWDHFGVDAPIVRFSSAQAATVLTGIRTKLIEWLCELQATLGDDETVGFRGNGLPTCTQSTGKMMIFISHSSTDVKLASDLVACIEACLEMPDGAVRCSSVPGYQLRPGDNAHDTLRSNLKAAKVVIGLLTDASLQSGYVVMELGAAWGLEKMTCPLLAPSVLFSRLPGPLVETHAVRIDDVSGIAGVMEVIRQATGVKPRNPAKFTAAVTAFARHGAGNVSP